MGIASAAPMSDRPPVAGWRRASASVPNGHCVEVLVGRGQVGLRDSKGAPNVQLRFGRRNWESFLARVRDGADLAYSLGAN
jgi:hypothetical protein